MKWKNYYYLNTIENFIDPYMGPQGIKGERGFEGPVGKQGFQGSRGPKGFIGPQGEQGPIGFRGIAGLSGDKGPTGENGLKGPIGDDGLQGYRGNYGLRGLQGEKGNIGMPGIQGYQGKKGPKGVKGNDGDNNMISDLTYTHLTDIYIASINSMDGFSTSNNTQPKGQWRNSNETNSTNPIKDWNLFNYNVKKHQVCPPNSYISGFSYHVFPSEKEMTCPRNGKECINCIHGCGHYQSPRHGDPIINGLNSLNKGMPYTYNINCTQIS